VHELIGFPAVLDLEVVVLQLAFGDGQPHVGGRYLTLDLDELDVSQIQLQIPIVLTASEIAKPGRPL
jgi:hypothetical protein